ncbi:ZIP zinc/iron transport family [Choiromyces venosus 120613-1]|uniref:ZIP zinc/iron transport family n=1 Tax=Choiromyces venosus 120613-1 TaxID=1336337 RepID=A0A3N4JSJ8_9PEZI|nr:ZIP zinc/iron transport family [Choiromyces venosus 120613-1]
MSVVNAMEFASLALRQAGNDEAGEAAPRCGGGNSYDGRMGLRISAVFVILLGSTFGALFPVVAKKNPRLKIPDWTMMFAKYFGSGVIICTAFIHLLTPANEALTDPCLTGPITEYPWAQGIALMSVFTVFFVELLAMRFATFSTSHLDYDIDNPSANREKGLRGNSPAAITTDPEALPCENNEAIKENYAAQMIGLFILEFGIIFHSIFIGLTLAVSGEEFTTLYVVLVFHQTFEGLGLGARLTTVPFPNVWAPYAMALGYGITTPIAIGIGLGARSTLDPTSQTALLLNGIFDAISAGILLYTGLVELMAHEFLFGPNLKSAKISYVMTAFVLMTLGAGLMALLGKWA